MKQKLAGSFLYGLVNNAGVCNMGEGTVDRDTLVRTNLHGVKLMTEAFFNMID